ncbi:YcfL family protein [Campylobacter ureolyticus]|uniref:YcfL family protein n=1 Tax=Campylobacter ureolyticus TaxID=827 RepID=UPI00215A1A88|nr:YcfL family protein [Campylobacter ureolyticus]MCR8699105.1 YcfL family protein [Campylobacter ureolyticus]
MKFTKYILLVFLILFTGCASNNQKIEPKFKQDNRIQYDDKSLHNWLEFAGLNEVKRSDGLIEFEALFINTSSSNKLVSYKIDWKDENGFTQKTIMSKWIKTLVESGRRLSIYGISPSVKSKDFSVILQTPTSDDKKRDDSYHKRYSN